MKMNLIFQLLAAFCLLGCDRSTPTSVQALDPVEQSVSVRAISVLAWNVESGGSDPTVIASQLTEFDHDIFALSEVTPRAFETYQDATGYRAIQGTTGGADRLMILFNDRFDLLFTEEQHDINDGNHRSPLLVRLRERSTDVVFQLNVNHLARGSAEVRETQADGLRDWAARQSLPTISIGDFNFDYSFVKHEGNSGFSAMLRDNVWMWVKPEEWIDTNWADGGRGRSGDGIDDYPDSMLDFAFVAGPAREWNPVCRNLKREGDFPDDESTSDHRPIELTLTPKL